MSQFTHAKRRHRLTRLGLGLLAAATALSLSACGGGDSSKPASTGNNGGGNNGGGTGTTPSVTKAIPAAGGTVPLVLSATSTLDLNFPAGAVPANTSVTVTQVPQSALTVPIAHALVAHGKASAKIASPRFTLNPNNVYIVAFQLTAVGVTSFGVPVNITGGSGLLPATLPANTVLNIAELQNGAYVDVGTVTTTATGGLTQQQASAALLGITQPGLYVVYQPAAGTNTAVANYGIALIADDGNGPGALQVVNLYDATGTPLATPKLTSLPFSNANDLDGEALTPDGTQGIMVDGGNTVRFFSGVNAGVPVASANTVDITSYGADGDSVAIMPNGDESVVSGDSDTSLLLISGILSGSPQPAVTLPVPSSRDGVAISNDGKVLLARGPSGLTVFAIAPVKAAAGPLGGTVSHTFTQTFDLTSVGTGGAQEDGRDGMAISPKDSSRAVVIGDSSGGASVSLLTGLPGTPVVSSLRLQLPAAKVRQAAARPERGAHPRLALTGVTSVASVAITPDGKNAIIGTNAGLVFVSGVDTGALAQVGTPFSPAITVSGANYTLAGIPTLGITLDGKYVVALTPQPSSTNGILLVIPIQAGGFGAPVGQLNGVAIPDNDQILIH